jgi:PadR family transcriptional regulator, regulatory protein PadR
VKTAEDPAAGLPRNYLRACILLLLGEGPSHGYELLEGMRALGLDRPDPGGLYRALRAMEQEGQVGSWWEPSGSGPPRRSYELTADGRRWLDASSEALRDVRRSLDVYLERCDALGGGSRSSIGPTAADTAER